MQKAVALKTTKKSEKDFIKILSEPKAKINLSRKKIKEIKKDFNKLKYGFSKSKINGFRRSLLISKNKKSFRTRNKRDWKKSEIKESESKYYDYDNTEFQGIRDIRNLFDEVDEVDEDYCKPIKKCF